MQICNTWTKSDIRYDNTIDLLQLFQVVELLLRHSNISNIHEALLHAISKGHEHIAECILKHPRYIEIKPKNKRIGETDHFFNQTKEDSPFSSDITPLILAAERNQIEIVQLLLLRGEKINKPHHYYCNCQECSNKLEFDELRLAKTRLNAYKGLASCTYISLTSEDPVLTAFDLARELRYVSTIEKSFKVCLSKYSLVMWTTSKARQNWNKVCILACTIWLKLVCCSLIQILIIFLHLVCPDRVSSTGWPAKWLRGQTVGQGQRSRWAGETH